MTISVDGRVVSLYTGVVTITLTLADLKALMLFAAQDPKTPRAALEGVAIWPEAGILFTTDGHSAAIRFPSDAEVPIPTQRAKLIPIAKLKAALPAGTKGDVTIEPGTDGVVLTFGGVRTEIAYPAHVSPPPLHAVIPSKPKAVAGIYVDARLLARLDAVGRACGYGKAMKAPWMLEFSGELDPIVARRPGWLAIIMPGRR